MTQFWPSARWSERAKRFFLLGISSRSSWTLWKDLLLYCYFLPPIVRLYACEKWMNFFFCGARSSARKECANVRNSKYYFQGGPKSWEENLCLSPKPTITGSIVKKSFSSFFPPFKVGGNLISFVSESVEEIVFPLAKVAKCISRIELCT